MVFADVKFLESGRGRRLRGRPVRRGPGRPDAGQSADLRRDLLRIALDEFLRAGFEGASISGICRAAGVSRDTFYRLYATKHALFRAATDEGLKGLAEHLTVVLSERGSMTEVLERVALQIDADMTNAAAEPVLRLIVAEAARFPDLGERFYASSRESLRPLMDYLDEQRTAGRLDYDDAFEAAFMLASLAIGGVRVFLERPRPEAAERRARARRAVRVLLAGWAPGGNASRR